MLFQLHFLPRWCNAVAPSARRGRNIILYLCMFEVLEHFVLDLIWDTMIKLLYRGRRSWIYFSPGGGVTSEKTWLTGFLTSELHVFDILWYECGRLDSWRTQVGRRIQRDETKQRNDRSDREARRCSPPLCTHRPACMRTSMFECSFFKWGCGVAVPNSNTVVIRACSCSLSHLAEILC